MDSNITGVINTAPNRSSGGKEGLSGGKTLPVKELQAHEELVKIPLVAEKSSHESASKAGMPLDIDFLEGQLDVLNEQLRSRQRDLSFEIDRASKTPVLKVIHAETGEVIRQIPNELALKIANSIHHELYELFDALA